MPARYERPRLTNMFRTALVIQTLSRPHRKKPRDQRYIPVRCLKHQRTTAEALTSRPVGLLASPGNLRGAQGPFGDFVSPLTPYPLVSAGQKRPLSAGGSAAEIATHVNHFSPNPNLLLPPVDPSRRLQSSPVRLVLTHDPSAEPDSQERSAKKPRRGRAIEESQQAQQQQQQQGQTATPPPNATKGARRLAPKLKTS